MAKGRIYTVIGTASTSVTTEDMLRIETVAGQVVRLLKLDVGQENNAQSADAETRRMTIIRQTTEGTGSTLVTARPHEVGDPAFGGTCRFDYGIGGSAGVVMQRYAWNNMVGIHLQWDEDDAFVISPTGNLTFRMNGGTNNQDLIFSATFEELTD